MRDFNIKFPLGTNYAEFDLRENLIEHNGFPGAVYWDYYHKLAKPVTELSKLISGAHSVVTLMVGNTYIDR